MLSLFLCLKIEREYILWTIKQKKDEKINPYQEFIFMKNK